MSTKYAAALKKIFSKVPKAVRRKRQRKQPTMYQNAVQLVPARAPFLMKGLTRTLRYVHVGTTITSTNGSIAETVFSANGAYDPDVTGAGHQPLFYDTLASMYNHYKVNSSRIQVFISGNQTSDVARSHVVGVCLDDDTSIAATTAALMEQPRNTWRMCYNCPGYNDIHMSNKPLVLKYNTKKFFGKRSGSDALEAAVTANPADQAYFHVYIVNLAGTTSSAIVTCVIDYNVSFDEPQDIPES